MTFRSKMRYIKNTFEICMAYNRDQSPRNLANLKRVLMCWTYHPYDLEDYGYQNEDGKALLHHIHYCSDRMNKGRALALLRLLND